MAADMTGNFGQLALLLAAALGAVVYRLRYLHADIGTARSLSKTLPVALLALLALWAGAGWLLVAALVLSACGDWFLSRSDRYFLPGLVAFLAGHLAYIGIFLQQPPLTSPPVLALQAAAILYGAGFAAVLWRRAGKLRLAVMFYILTISVMAIGSTWYLPANPLVTFGAFLFVFSDSALAIRMFIVGESAPKSAGLGVIVWWSYIAAQFALLLGLSNLLY